MTDHLSHDFYDALADGELSRRSTRRALISISPRARPAPQMHFIKACSSRPPQGPVNATHCHRNCRPARASRAPG